MTRSPGLESDVRSSGISVMGISGFGKNQRKCSAAPRRKNLPLTTRYSSSE